MERDLVLIPAASSGHLAPMVELGKALTSRYDQISITIFLMERPFHSTINSYIQTLVSNLPPPRMRFIHLTVEEPTPENLPSKSTGNPFLDLALVNKSRVEKFYKSEPSDRISAFVLDMFCTAFADVADGFGVPSYIFITTNASFLNLMFHLQKIHDYENQDFTEFKDLDLELSVPGFVNPLPVKVLPYIVFDKDIWGPTLFVDIPRKLRKARGILVNTFTKLESNAIKSLFDNGMLPPIYPVGPVLNLEAKVSKDKNDLGQWLDNQPPSSVVFLCFGSMGTFQAEQIVEIACALEQSGYGFLWALRKPPTKDGMGISHPSEYENFNDVLPEGFIDRTKEFGKVVGWAPQVSVLSHPALGGFVSHSGWNSTVESLWFGVPTATWPLYAEQHMNAFVMVKELELAVEIKLDFPKHDQIISTSQEIQRGIKQLMEGSESIKMRKKVQAMKEESRRAVEEGGSSYVALEHFIEEVLNSS